MSTSQFQGVILYDPGDLDTDEPMDTVLVRDEIIDSALHKADEAGQVRCSWVALSDDVNDPFTGAAPLHLPYDEDAFSDAGTDRWLDFAWRGGFDAKVRSDGSGYRMRVMIAGATDTGLGPAVDFLIAVGPPTLSFDDAEAFFTAYDTVTGVTSATPAWLTLDSGLTYIDIPKEIVDDAKAREASLSSTLTDIAGDPATVQTVRLEVMVCARYENVGAKPVLWGVHVADYIGG